MQIFIQYIIEYFLYIFYRKCRKLTKIETSIQRAIKVTKSNNGTKSAITSNQRDGN